MHLQEEIKLRGFHAKKFDIAILMNVLELMIGIPKKAKNLTFVMRALFGQQKLAENVPEISRKSQKWILRGNYS